MRFFYNVKNVNNKWYFVQDDLTIIIVIATSTGVLSQFFFIFR
jgi:hypothetical protein